MDGRVPGDAVPVGLEERVDLRRQRRVLDPGLREGRDDTAVEVGIRLLVHDRPAVEALEIDRVHGAGRAQLGDQLVAPGRRRVELEAQSGVGVEPPPDRVDRGRLAQAQRHDEGQRARLPPEHLVQRTPGLAQGEVERGAVERPPPVEARDLPLGLLGKQVERRDQLAERGDGVLSGERLDRPRGLQRLVVDRVVGDVLADPLLARATKANDGGLARELRRDVADQPLEVVGLDDEGEVRETLVGAQASTACSGRTRGRRGG